MKLVLKTFMIFVCCLYFISFDVSANEIKGVTDYTFASYNLIDVYEMDAIAKEIKEHKYDKAEESLKYISNICKITAEYYLFLGEIELHKNNLDLANVYLTKALDIVSSKDYELTKKINKIKASNTPILYNEFSKMYLAKRNYKKALEYSDKAMSFNKLEKEFIVTRIDILKNYNIENPKNIVKSDVFVGDIPKLKNFKDTTESWEEILNILEKFDACENNSNYTFGEILSLTKKQKESKAKRENLLKILPLAYLAKTELVYSLGYKNEAKNLANNFINVASTSDNRDMYAKAFWVKAIILSDGFEDYNAGITAITNALQIDPSNDGYYLQRSWMYVNNKQKDFAMADIDKCIELNPTNNIAYEYKAYYLEYMGNRQEALENYKKALEINPNSQNAKNCIKKIQERNKAEAKQKASGIDTHTSTRLSVSANLVEMMKGTGFLKRIQKSNNETIIFFVDEKSWYNSSADGIINTIDVAEEYAYLRGYEIIDFKSSSSGKLLYRHRIKFIEIP